MKKLIYILSITAIVLFSLVALSSCNKQLQSSITQSQSHVVHDTVTTAVSLRVDTVIIPADTVSLVFPIMVDCPDNAKPVFKPVHISSNSKRADVTFSIDSAGNLQADSHCKKLAEMVSILDSTITKQSATIDSFNRSQTTVVQVRFIPGAYKFSMGFTVSFFLLLILFIAYKILKKTPYGSIIPF